MVLAGRRAGMYRRSDIRELAMALALECVAVATAEGARLDAEVAAKVVDGLASMPADMAPRSSTTGPPGGRWSGTPATAWSAGWAPGTACQPRSVTCWCRCWRRPATTRTDRIDPARQANPVQGGGLLVAEAVRNRRNTPPSFASGAPGGGAVGRSEAIGLS